MKQRNHRRNLLIALVVLLSCAFIGVSGLNYMVTKDAIHTQILQNDLPLTMNNIYSDISSELTRPIMVSIAMATDTFLKEWIMDGEVDSDKVQKYLQQIHEKYEYFSTFFVSSLTSNYYHFKGVQKQISPASSHDVWYYTFLDSGKEYDLDVDADEAGGNMLTIFINCRVEDEQGRLLGVTGVGVKVANIADLVKTYKRKFNRAVYLTDKNGIIQVHRDTSLIDKVTIHDLDGVRVVANDILSKRTDGGNFEYRENGEKILLNVKYIEMLDWYLFVEQNETESLRIARMNLLRSLLIGVCVTVCVSILMLFTLNYYHRRLDQLIDEDSLTGLANRRRLEKEFERLVQWFKRSRRPFSLLLMDLDGFKEVNDTLGHIEGDSVLKILADTLSESIRPTDILARWGGDEFCLLLVSDAEGSKIMAERIIGAVADISWPMSENEGLELLGSLTISCGVVQYCEGESLDMLLERADNMLYRCKEMGGNCVVTA